MQLYFFIEQYSERITDVWEYCTMQLYFFVVCYSEGITIILEYCILQLFFVTTCYSEGITIILEYYTNTFIWLTNHYLLYYHMHHVKFFQSKSRDRLIEEDFQKEWRLTFLLDTHDLIHNVLIIIQLQSFA